MVGNNKKTTITDIAEMCGVSIKTVSRVINGSKNVSTRTKMLVEQAIKDSDYQANILARGLKGNKTNVIMVFTERHEEEHLSAWHTIMLKYIFRYARERQLKVIVSPSSGNRFMSDETDGYYLLENGIADGAILLEKVENDMRIKFLKEKNIPFVVFGESEDEEVCSVSLDNYQVGLKGATYLIGRGYKDIEFLVGDSKYSSNKKRANGFIDTTKKFNGNYNVQYGCDTVEKAFRMAADILRERKPDAFFVSGDERAIGVYRAISEAGYFIPDDVAVLGVDNIPIGNFLHPRISTVDQDFETMSRQCVDLLYRLINDEDIVARRKIELLPSVIEREST